MGRATPGLTARIAAHIATAEYESLSPATIDATKRALLDGIGVILAASGMSGDIAPFVAVAASRSDPFGSTILGHRLKCAPAAAAFANGAMSHALDFEDAFDLAPVHPNASLIPAALAVAEANGPVSGKRFIAAMATGCDLACRLGLGLGRPMEDGGWYPPPILGSFAAAAAAARLMKLSPPQVADAFSLMLCQVSCPGEIKYSRDTVIRAVREAFPAQAAVISAELASRGVRGFDHVLEGKAGFFRLYADGQYDEDTILAGLGEDYWIEQLSFKPWPACRGTHAYIEAIRLLVAERGFGWRDVAAIQLGGGEVQQMLMEPLPSKQRPATAIDAKFSLPFTVAIALVRGDVTLDDFLPAALADRDLLEAAAKVSFQTVAGWGRERFTSGKVKILLESGAQFEAEIAEPLGSPRRPLSDAQLSSKFADCTSRSERPRSRAEIDRVAQRILALECEPDVGALIAEF